MTAIKTQQTDAIELLHKRLQAGDTVWTILKHVSQSGMYRVIDLYVIKGNEPLRISYSAGILSEGYDRRQEGAKSTGVGMDAGHKIVEDIGARLYPDGFGEQCTDPDCSFRPASRQEAEHCNDNLREGVTPHTFRGRNGDQSGWDNIGGFALQHRWM